MKHLKVFQQAEGMPMLATYPRSDVWVGRLAVLMQALRLKRAEEALGFKWEGTFFEDIMEYFESTLDEEDVGEDWD